MTHLIRGSGAVNQDNVTLTAAKIPADTVLVSCSFFQFRSNFILKKALLSFNQREEDPGQALRQRLDTVLVWL